MYELFDLIVWLWRQILIGEQQSDQKFPEVTRNVIQMQLSNQLVPR